MNPGKTRPIDPEDPKPETIAETAAVLAAGGVVVFPTRFLYGLGVDAFNEGAVQRLFEIKARPARKPLLILIEEPRRLKALVQEIPAGARILMERFWPGQLTLVFWAKEALPDMLTAKTGKIGIRLAGNRVAAALVKTLGRPITGTSANLSGRPGVFRIADLDPALKRRVDRVLDAGPLKGGAGSTVVDVTCDPPKILREGAISNHALFETLGQVPQNTS